MRAYYGFTLIEVLTSVLILATVTIVSVAKFRTIQQDDALDLAATRAGELIRKAQNYAQSGRRLDYPFAEYYGVYVSKVSSTAFLFADNNTADAVGVWDGDRPAPGGRKDAQIGQSVSFDPLQKGNVFLETLSVGGNDAADVTIGFRANSSVALVNGARSQNNTAVLTLKNRKTNMTKTLTFHRVSGRIDISP